MAGTAPRDMQVTVQKLSPVLVEFDVQVDAARVTTELNKAYQSLSKTAKVRGFRPGKAPRKVLVHMFGPRIAADVAQRLVDDTFQKAVSEQKVQPVSQPAIEPEQLVENQPFSYKARFEILPQIEQLTYDGFEIKRKKIDVSEEQVRQELDHLRRDNSTLEAPKDQRAARMGDVITVDFKVEVGGIDVADAGAEGFQGELGSGTFLPAIEAALDGKNSGETVRVDVDMPPSHPHPALKGQRATFVLTLKDFKERILPEADDEFAKDLGEYETLDDLKKELKEQVAKRLKEEADNAVAEALVLELVKRNAIEVPTALIEQQTRVTEQEVLQRARRQGQVGGLSPELRAKVRADSEVKVRAGLLMAEIAKRENIQIGDAEIEEGLKELSEQTGKNIAKLRAEYREPKQREMLIGIILENKVLDIIESKAKIEEQSGA